MELDHRDGTEDLRLPFDVRTAARGVWRRRYAILLVLAVSAAGGVAAGLHYGSRVYQSEAVMHFRAVGGARGGEVTTSLNSLANQVKVVPNIREIRERLHLPVMLDEVGKAIEVTVPDQSTLMIIKGRWDDPDTAARIANVTRDVFLEHWFTSLLVSIDSMYEQAMTEKQTAEMQSLDLQRRVEEIAKHNAETGRLAGQRAVDSLKYQWLRDTIRDEEKTRADLAELAVRKAELERAQDLNSKGLVPKLELEKTQREYERQRMIAHDNPPITDWKDKLKRLGARLLKTEVDLASMPTYDDMLLKVADAEIQRISLAQKLGNLSRAREGLQESLARLATLKSNGDTSGTRHDAVRKEIDRAQRLLARIRGLYDTESTEFVLVSDAAPPTLPVDSTRRLVALAVGAALATLGLGIVVGRELFTSRIRSHADLAVKLSLDVAGTVPPLNGRGLEEPALAEAAVGIAQVLRHRQPRKGARLLLGAPSRGTGTTTVATALAAAFGRQGERVLLIDADLRDSVRPAWASTLVAAKGPRKGLGSYLSTPGIPVESVIHRTIMPAVDVVPFDGVPASPELLGASPFETLLDTLGQRYSVVIIDAPPVLASADAVLLSKWADLAVLVARGDESRAGDLERAEERLRAAGATVAGAILNDADPYFNG